MDIEDFPWTGNYFGGMENKIKAKVFNEFDPEYFFSHWESTNGNVIFPDSNSIEATTTLTAEDTLIAVFTNVVNTKDLTAQFDLAVYPYPAKDFVTLSYDLETSTNVQVALYSLLGQKIVDFPTASRFQPAGNYKTQLYLEDLNLSSSLYFLEVQMDDQKGSFKVNVMK